MIGSPWNPFFDQAIPGTAQRFDGRSVDSGPFRQRGGWDLLSLPTYLEWKANPVGGTLIPNTYNELTGQLLVEAPEPILTRQFGLQPVPGESAVVDKTAGLVAGDDTFSPGLAFALGDAGNNAFGTQTAIDVMRTGFLWWYNDQLSWNHSLPAALWRSEAHPINKLRYWVAIGVIHGDGRFNGISEPTVDGGWDFHLAVTAWIRQDGPRSLGGRGDQPGTSANPGGFDDDPEEGYPLFASEMLVENDKDGFRGAMVGDLLQEIELTSTRQQPESDPPVYEILKIQPWFHPGERQESF